MPHICPKGSSQVIIICCNTCGEMKSKLLKITNLQVECIHPSLTLQIIIYASSVFFVGCAFMFFIHLHTNIYFMNVLCIGVHVCERVHTHVCTWLWMPDVSLILHSQKFHPLLLRQGLQNTNYVRLLKVKPMNHPISTPQTPSHCIKSMVHHSAFVMWVLGIKLMSYA